MKVFITGVAVAWSLFSRTELADISSIMEPCHIEDLKSTGNYPAALGFRPFKAGISIAHKLNS